MKPNVNMLPVRGPIQVTLDDSGSGIQCVKPQAQVRILSRPRVGTLSLENGNNGSLNSTATTSASKIDRNQKIILSSPKQSSSIRPQQQQQSQSQPTTSSQNHPNQLQQPTQPALNHRDGDKANKKLMKTYQERADEYAKARLRILGSAFPENDDSLSTNDDINRILNLDHNAPSNGPTIEKRNGNNATSSATITNGLGLVSDSDNYRTNYKSYNVDYYLDSNRRS